VRRDHLPCSGSKPKLKAHLWASALIENAGRGTTHHTSSSESTLLFSDPNFCFFLFFSSLVHAHPLPPSLPPSGSPLWLWLSLSAHCFTLALPLIFFSFFSLVRGVVARSLTLSLWLSPLASPRFALHSCSPSCSLSHSLPALFLAHEGMHKGTRPELAKKRGMQKQWMPASSAAVRHKHLQWARQLRNNGPLMQLPTERSRGH